MKRSLSALVFAAAALAGPLAHAQPASQAIKATLYKNPICPCCEVYAEALKESGIDVTIVKTENLEIVKKQAGVSDELVACHTMLLGDYVVEGLVPLNVVERLLTERPDIRGIALPGMPMGAVGMAGEKMDPFRIYTISNPPTVYAVE